MSAKRRHSDEVRQRVRQLIGQGVPVRAICQRLHVSETSVKRERSVLKSQRAAEEQSDQDNR